MKMETHNPEDFDMRFRFAKQTIRFWQESRQRDEQESTCVDEDHTNVRSQDDRSKRPALDHDSD